MKIFKQEWTWRKLEGGQERGLTKMKYRFLKSPYGNLPSCNKMKAHRLRHEHKRIKRILGLRVSAGIRVEFERTKLEAV